MKNGLQVPLFALLDSIAEAIDLVSPLVTDHHRQVAYFASGIGAALGLPEEQRIDLMAAGKLHDIGALHLQERVDTLQFEDHASYQHAERGYLLLKTFQPLASIAGLVRFHHVPWEWGAGCEFTGQPVPAASHIVHLADRVAVLIDRRREILGQVGGIVARIKEHAGKTFRQDMVDALLEISVRESFWLQAVSSTRPILPSGVGLALVQLDLEGLLGLAKFFASIIDCRSRFTATHSSGVAATAETLARLAGLPEAESRVIRIAGYLHDLGKLSVPVEILEKPAQLSREEFYIIKGHAFYTHYVLSAVSGLETIKDWASFHHERLDGKGYPFHIKGEELPLGSQIMAVADIFTAITEERPYRKGMDRTDALQVLVGMGSNSGINPELVSILSENFDEVDGVRRTAQKTEARGYRELYWSLGQDRL